ncbi:hypothetical protein LX32DRAFT_637537 [Colletotrichum zoysiae]|uniref:DUF7730 domain-containing protein n=1 Tax=Colletotrichum zoysiae TaxID=1216348 RepID=A0AAD9HL78_9PEZI|nr:hypothetical protein LX32DRAFT_637537 [Colletotrichum zoysiae]
MVRSDFMKRASQRCMKHLRRKLSSRKTRQETKSSSIKRLSKGWFSSSRKLLLPKKYKGTVDDEATPKDSKDDTPAQQPHQFHYFSKLPPEIRVQIYQEFWAVAGVKRHVFLHNYEITYSPCITDHTAPDERQIGVAKAFKESGSEAEVQLHPEWYKRMTSKWCNHWRCERLWEEVRDGKKIDAHKTQSYMSLLLSCRWIYRECHWTFKEHKTLTITDGKTLQRIFQRSPIPYLYEATYINISLREDSGNWLYLNGSSMWYILSEHGCKMTRTYLWLDAECPVTRRMLTEFRDLFNKVPSAMARRLTVDLPCDAHDGFWAWDEVERETKKGSAGGYRDRETEWLAPLVPEFAVVARGRQRFNETSGGYVSSADQARPKRRVLRASNPFEDVLLYGTEFLDTRHVWKGADSKKPRKTLASTWPIAIGG